MDLNYVCTIFISSPIGVPIRNLSWRGKVINYLKKLKLRKRIQLVKDRKAWNDPVQKTTFQVVLYSRKKKNKKKCVILAYPDGRTI